MLRSLKHLWLGLALIAVAAGILLCSDLGRRQRNRPAPARIPRVALFQFTSTSLIDDTVRGVVEGLAAAGFVDGQTIKLERFNASGDYATASAIARDLAAGGYDQIVTVSTPALQVMATANRDGRTPHVFGTVTDPYGSGVGIAGPAPAQHPAHLVGIGTFQPVTNIFRLARRMNPQLRRVGAVWNPTEHNSEACVLQARAVCRELGIELVEANAGNTSEVPEAIRSVLSREVDAVWIGGDTVVNSSAGSIIAIARAAGVPVFTNDPTDAARGALFSLGASYPDVGRTIAALAARILRGTDPRTIGVENVVPERLAINRDVLSAFATNWSASPELLAQASATAAPAVATTAAAPVAKPAAKPTPGRTYKVNLVYMTPHKLFDEAIDGVRKALAEQGFVDGKNLRLSISHANGDMSMMQQIALNVSATDADLVMSLSTPALAAVAGRVKDKPVVFAEVTEPVGAGAGKSFTDHQPNVTGAVAPAPLEGGFTWLLKLYPKIKKIGMIYTPSEPNVMTEVRLTEEFAKKYGFELVRRAANNPSEVAEALTAVVSEGIDAFFLEGDNSIMSASSLIVSTCRKHGIPLLADDESGMGTGALLACGVSPEGNGHFGGLIAARVLLGENPATIPFTPSTAADLALDFAPAAQLNFTFPPEILREANIFHHVASRFGRPARLAVVNLVQNPNLDLAEKGLLRGLDQSGLVEGTDFVLQHFNAQGEIAQLPQLFDAALATQPDLIFTVTTPAFVVGARKVTTVPLVFTVCSEPAKLGLFLNGKPANLTGVHDNPPMDKLLDMAAAYRPGLTTVGTVFNPAEDNARLSAEKLRAICQRRGLTLHEVTVSTVSELAPAAQALVQRGAQAILTSADNLVATGFPSLARTAKSAGIPVFTTEPDQVAIGATGASGDDFEEWGAQSGRLAAKVLAGLSPAALPFEVTAVQHTIVPEPPAPAVSTVPAPIAPPPAAPAKPWQVRIVAFNDTTMSEQCQQGLKDGLARGGLVEGRDFALKVLNAQGDMSTLTSIVGSVRSEQADLLLVITTNALQTALRQAGDTHIVFTGVADAVQAGAGKSETDHLPNVTGITTRSAFDDMTKLVRELIPNARRVGTLFTPSELNSVIYKDWFAEALKRDGIELVAVPVTGSAETAEAIDALCRQQLDAVCQVADNTTRPGFGLIIRKATESGLPVFCFETNHVKTGAVLALARDYYDASVEAGEVAVRVLRGENPANIPFANTRSETLTINPAAAGKVGLALPAGVLQRAKIPETRAASAEPARKP